MAVQRDSMIDPSEAMRKAHARRVSVVTLPSRAQDMRSLAVHAVIFLETRPYQIEVGKKILSVLTITPI